MPLPTLKVELDGPTGRGARVFLDGHDIAEGLLELDISFRNDDLTRASMVIGVGALEIDAQTLSILQANVKVTDPAAAAQPDDLDLRTFGEEPCHA